MGHGMPLKFYTDEMIKFRGCKETLSRFGDISAKLSRSRFMG